MIKLPKTLLLFSLAFVLLICSKSFAFAQDLKERNEVVKFGVGLKLVATSDLLSGGASSFLQDGVTFFYEPNLSRGIDALIRFKLKNRFSFQTGLSSIRRSYNYGMATDSLQFSGSIIQTSFQLPVSGVLQVQISKQSKMGVEAGFIAEMIPGEVGNGGQGYYAFIHIYSKYKLQIKTSLRAAAHYNYSLSNGGQIEAGVQYVRMINRLGSFYMDYDPPPYLVSARRDLQGHYFAGTISYFFP